MHALVSRDAFQKTRAGLGNFDMGGTGGAICGKVAVLGWMILGIKLIVRKYAAPKEHSWFNGDF